jgi:hypothetical protein
MKINLIPTKKLALLSAAFCAVMLAFSHNASAVTDLTINDGHWLGQTFNISSLPAYSDADKAALINHLINQDLQTSDDVGIGLQIYLVGRSGNDFGSLPATSVTGAVSGTGTNINIGSGTYSYLFATYSGPNNPGVILGLVWYIGNLSGDITIPATTGTGFNLIGWTLFGPGVPGVADGGTTVMLLGAALGALGMARRFLKA